MPFNGKVLWSRRRKKEKKPNKRVSPNLSYQRHHLIRISSCHKTTSKKKTKKRILLKKFIPSKSSCSMHSILLESGAPHAIKRRAKRRLKNEFSSKNSSHQSPVAACIQFFWKVVLLPSRI